MTYSEAEHRRLEAVRSTGLLDTGPEQAYDDLVQLAACICQVPISLVTLVDEHRLWLKAKVGVPISEVPRDFSFCSFTIQQDGLFVIPDTLEDPRYATNISVTGAPCIRFYAGYPLSTSSGEKLGSLCIVDCVPRELNADQQMAMQVLGRQVTAQIELKQRLDALHTALQQKQLTEVALQSSQRMLESANTQLLQQSLTDSLTGLDNRRAFEIALDREFQRSRRSTAPLSLLMLDIDSFKSFNDSYGHVQGDEVLRRVGSLIYACSRESDITARYGGEEFIIILPDTTSEQALHLAARLNAAISTEVWNLRQITTSIGVATLDTNMLTHYALVNAADQALYQAKNSGKNCIHAFNLENSSGKPTNHLSNLSALSAPSKKGFIGSAVASTSDEWNASRQQSKPAPTPIVRNMTDRAWSS